MDQPRLHIDWTRCDGRGLCAELLDGVLRRDRWGYPLAVGDVDRSDVPIPEGDEEAALDAVRLCPVQALRVLQEPR